MTWVCITAKNEAGTIFDLVRRLLRDNHRVILVDDGSDDATARQAIAAGVTILLSHHTSHGIGPSLMEAWQAALNEGAEHIAQIDAGGSHDPIDLAGLLSVSADLVVGSRFMKGGRYIGRPWRAYGSRLAAAGLNLTSLAPWITDWTSGYRAFTARAAAELLKHSYTSTMHAWQIEILQQAVLLGLTIGEAPITYRAGQSSLKLKTVGEAVRVWARTKG